jgi:hypothetical protein
LIKQVNEYMATEPTGADEDCLILWRKLIIFDCAMFEKFWLMVDDEKIDYRDCKFENFKICNKIRRDSMIGKAMLKGEIQ